MHVPTHPHTKGRWKVQNRKAGAHQALDPETQSPTLFQSTTSTPYNKAPSV